MRRLPSAGARARARAPRVARADVLAAALDGAITRSGVQAAPARRPSLVLQSLRLSSLVGHDGRERACARFYSAKGLLIARRPSSRLPPQLPSHLDSRILTVAYLWLRCVQASTAAAHCPNHCCCLTHASQNIHYYSSTTATPFFICRSMAIIMILKAAESFVG